MKGERDMADNGMSNTGALGRKQRRPRRLRAKPKHPLTVPQILAWADAHFSRAGRWPIARSGRIREAVDDTWLSVDKALRVGRRGMKGDSSLARLLSEYRGVRNRKALPPYTVPQILDWADDYYRSAGRWPNEDSGTIDAAPGETWKAVESALRQGARGLPGGSSLARLLATHRGLRNTHDLPELTIGRILEWADAYRKRLGRWPKAHDGAIVESPGDNWRAIDACLMNGGRGLPGGQSLARLLSCQRGVRNHKGLPPLTKQQILTWASAYRKRAGAWPTLRSGVVSDAPGETWCAVDAALSQGGRGLQGGSSLALLLKQHRGLRHKRYLPRFTVGKITAWARAHYRRTGKFPTAISGPVLDSPGDTWMAVQVALHLGRRGLPGGSSLARLIAAIERV